MSRAFLVKMVPRGRKDALVSSSIRPMAGSLWEWSDCFVCFQGKLAPQVLLEKVGLQGKMGTRGQWVLLDSQVAGALTEDLDHLVRQHAV